MHTFSHIRSERLYFLHLSHQVDQDLHPSAQCCTDRCDALPLETVRHCGRQHVGHRQWLEYQYTRAQYTQTRICLQKNMQSENQILVLTIHFSLHWSRLPPFLLWERTLFSYRLQVRMSVLYILKSSMGWFPLSFTLCLSDVTRVSAVRPVSSPPRRSRRSCRRVSLARASPPTTASPRSVGLRSALDVGCWRVARPWFSTETAGGTWSPLHWTVPRPGSKQPKKIHLDRVSLSSGV